jgi:hypothetical protein
MKIISILLFLLSLNAFASVYTVTYDRKWKRITIDTEIKEMRIQSWDVGEQDFKDKFVLKSALILISKDTIVIYPDENKERVMGKILKMPENNEVEVSVFLYDNKKFKTSQHENLFEVFDF